MNNEFFGALIGAVVGIMLIMIMLVAFDITSKRERQIRCLELNLGKEICDKIFK